MTPPDLSNPSARAAYRNELRSLARAARLVGLFFVLTGAALLAWPRMDGPWFLGHWPTQRWGWMALALGWLIWICVIAYRSFYHKQRMTDARNRDPRT